MKRVKKLALYCWFFSWLWFLAFLVFDLSSPFKFELSYSQLIQARDSTVIHGFLSKDDKWRMYTELEEITPKLKEAFLTKEDQLFYYHPGVDPLAIGRAIVKNTLKSKKTSGASTITMQVARLLEPKERTYLNKFYEMFRAFQLEWYYSKEEILQLYLNLVPYGGNIEGVKSAALIYYGKLPQALSPAEITALTIIPNRPTSLQPGNNDEVLIEERNRWLNMLQQEGVFTDNELTQALKEPLGMGYKPVPKQVPHFSYRVKDKFPEQQNIHTYLNPHLQFQVQSITYNYIKRIKYLNINNASVIVIDNKTQEIVCYLGSNDFSDIENHGQVDGINAIRSPGSTLKPLVYAMAFDRGYITPKTKILDVETEFGSYAPENFDKKFHGRITVEEALAYSLNVPAVKTLKQMGVEPMIDILSRTGFHQISRDSEKLGLSLALGGCGVTLEELALLYNSFANGGTSYGLHWTKKQPQQDSLKVVSAEAAYMLANVLTQLTRPDLPYNYQSSYHVPKVAWKTGTSYGRRDAWSIGYNKNYTVGVWVGNFDGEGIFELTGASKATPLLFEIFNTIDYDAPDDWFDAPPKISRRFVCAETGMPVQDFCESEVYDIFLPGISYSTPCNGQKTVYTSANDSLSYCTTCMPTAGYKKQHLPNYPAELITYFEQHGIAYKKIPPHNPSCTRIFHDHNPVINSPVDGKSYILDRDDPAEIMLTCSPHNDVREVYWYLNNTLYKTAKPQEKVFFKPDRGKTKISCSDDKGRNSDIYISVEWE